MEKLIKKLADFSKKEGLESFILMAKNGPMVTMHLENINIQSAMQMIIVGFHQIISMELEKHPEYPEDYKKLYTNLGKDFNSLIKDYDQKFLDFQKNLKGGEDTKVEKGKGKKK
jgi:hypothetical protein